MRSALSPSVAIFRPGETFAAKHLDERRPAGAPCPAGKHKEWSDLFGMVPPCPSEENSATAALAHTEAGSRQGGGMSLSLMTGGFEAGEKWRLLLPGASEPRLEVLTPRA